MQEDESWFGETEEDREDTENEMGVDISIRGQPVIFP